MSDQQRPLKKRRGCYTCDICERRGADHSSMYPSIYGLKRHIFSTHLCENGFVLRCNIDRCPIQLPNRRQLYNHVSKSHPGRQWIPHFEDLPMFKPDDPDITLEDEDITDMGEESVDVCKAKPEQTGTALKEHNELTSSDLNIMHGASAHSYVIDDEDVHLYNEMRSLTNEQRQIRAALSVAALKANHSLSQLALEAAQRWAEGLLANAVKTVIGGVKLINSQNSPFGIPSTDLDEVFELGEGMTNPFHGLDSEWMLKKILREKLGYVEPETVILYEGLSDGPHGENKIHTMQYVPILDVLKLLYRDKNFRLQIDRRHAQHSKQGVMADFMDGAYFKRHPLFTKNSKALQLQLYYDGFEVVNPLGSKIQRHNVGALYFSILNLEPAYRSTLKSICLTGLVYEKDIKHPDIGWDVILQRFNADLQTLENGIHFNIDGENVFVQGTIAQCAMDNKAAHSLFGMQDSFCGKFISRYCLCSSDDIQAKITGAPSQGVKSKCYIKSQYFHRGDAFAADIHHDVLEGLIPGMLKPILQALIQTKRLFTVQLLNSRISNFDYNRHDIKNRPSVITEAKLREDSRSLKQYAAQYWCLLRKLPLIVGDRVPEGDEHWSLLLQLLDVVDLIMCPKVDDGKLSYLDMQLTILFNEFKLRFPEVRITPKMHYTLHYPRLMKEVGPLIRHWVMRYEAKHHFFKRATIISGNYINVPKTLAQRHQLQQVVHLHQGGLLSRDISVTEGHSVDIADLKHGAQISAVMDVSRVTVCTKIAIHGTVYSVGDAVLVSVDSGGFIQFGQIINVIVTTSEKVCFLVSMLDVSEYDEHFHSWRIQRAYEPEVVVAMYDSLPDYHPVGLHYTFGDDSAWYANLRYSVLCDHE